MKIIKLEPTADEPLSECGLVSSYARRKYDRDFFLFRGQGGVNRSVSVPSDNCVVTYWDLGVEKIHRTNRRRVDVCTKVNGQCSSEGSHYCLNTARQTPWNELLESKCWALDRRRQNRTLPIICITCGQHSGNEQRNSEDTRVEELAESESILA
jgi:hypothetical protein